MKKLILLFLLITTGLFAQITRAPLWTLSGTTLSPLSSTYGIALGGATLGGNILAIAGSDVSINADISSTINSAIRTLQLVRTGTGAIEFRLTLQQDEARFSTISADPITFFTNNTEALRIASTGNVLIGTSTAVDTQSPDLIITGDADSDGTAFTTEALTVSLTSNATPTLATWGFTSTQGAGYTFDKAVTITGLLTAKQSTFGTGITAGLPLLVTNKAGSTMASIDSLGTTLVGNGTVALPSMSFLSDPNTGIYRKGADTLGIAVNGANQVTVTTTGVGIGTIVSTGQLTVLKNNNNFPLVNTDAHLVLENTTGVQSLLIFSFNGTPKGGIRGDDAGNFNWHAIGAQGHQFYNSIDTASPVMGISSSGVEIGGGSGAVSVNRLDVYGAAAIGYTATFPTAPANGLLIAGNVGIGETAPPAVVSIKNATPTFALYDSDLEKVHATFAAVDSAAVTIDVNSGAGRVNWYGTDGDAGNVAINTSDALTFNSFSGGYSFDGAITSTSNISIWDSLTVRKEKSQLADSLGVITLATGVSGWGEVMAGDNQEWASFRFSSDGTVTLIANTANVTTTVNSVDKLNIYDAGTGVVIQNNLGASKKVAININYFIP